ncbi:hypothetical protein BC830DRAFT_1081898 [Chytriomyces sp. MP71]|nr:hypothetical protein BC830DRAFT_1081898 [Chytriomyces sp. MP71]
MSAPKTLACAAPSVSAVSRHVITVADWDAASILVALKSGRFVVDVRTDSLKESISRRIGSWISSAGVRFIALEGCAGCHTRIGRLAHGALNNLRFRAWSEVLRAANLYQPPSSSRYNIQNHLVTKFIASRKIQHCLLAQQDTRANRLGLSIPESLFDNFVDYMQAGLPSEPTPPVPELVPTKLSAYWSPASSPLASLDAAAQGDTDPASPQNASMSVPSNPEVHLSPHCHIILPTDLRPFLAECVIPNTDSHRAWVDLSHHSCPSQSLTEGANLALKFLAAHGHDNPKVYGTPFSTARTNAMLGAPLCLQNVFEEFMDHAVEGNLVATKEIFVTNTCEATVMGSEVLGLSVKKRNRSEELANRDMVGSKEKKSSHRTPQNDDADKENVALPDFASQTSALDTTDYLDILTNLMPDHSSLDQKFQDAIRIGVKLFLRYEMGDSAIQDNLPAPTSLRIPSLLVDKFKVWLSKELKRLRIRFCLICCLVRAALLTQRKQNYVHPQ